MDITLLEKLSNADGIAANEDKVRKVILNELGMYKDSTSYDRLGSLLITKKSYEDNAPTVMFAAHLDEVGFMVRNISEIGMVYLMPVGGVEDRAKINQLVRIITQNGTKFEGLLNVTKNSKGQIEDMYVDLGFDSKKEVLSKGIQIGDMVVFDSVFRVLNNSKIVAGKAMDDRAGVFALATAMKLLYKIKLNVNIVAAFTSSEEVGCRGARTSTNLINPDLIFAVDVAKHPELDQGFTNHRKLGFGPMIEFYDKTMIPNRKLINFVRNLAKSKGIPYQEDMFKGGGTDAGTSHLEHKGIASAVLGFPIKYCHDPYSYANIVDFENLTKLIYQLAVTIDKNIINDFYNFGGDL